jgi:hypothetical protein
MAVGEAVALHQEPAPEQPGSLQPLEAVTMELESTEEAMEAAVRETATLQQLTALIEKHDLAQLSPRVLVLLCNQLARVSDTSPHSTVRAWTEAQVRGEVPHANTPHACMQVPPAPRHMPCKQRSLLTRPPALDALAPQVTLELLMDSLEPHLASLDTYDLIVVVASMARLRHAPSLDWLARFLALSEPRLKDCGTGNLTMLIRAFSRLGMQPWDLKVWQMDGLYRGVKTCPPSLI